MLLTLHLVMLCTFANAKNLGYRPDLLSETNFYAGGNYVRGLTQEFRVEAFAGAYIVGLNVEGGYMVHTDAVKSVWWLNDGSFWSGTEGEKYEYCLSSAISANVGYGILLGNRIRITSRIGAVFNGIEGKYLGSKSDMDHQTFVVSGSVGLRTEISPFEHVSLVLVPTYNVPLMMGDLASQIDKTSTLIKEWCGGLSFNIGLELYF